LGEYFEVDMFTKVEAAPGKQYVVIVIVLSFKDSPILRDLKRLKRMYPDTPIVGLTGEGRSVEVAYGDYPEIDLVLDGKEYLPEVAYRLYRVNCSAPIGRNEVIIYKNKTIGQIIKAVQERAGPSGDSVLLTGEQGVGKTTIAKLIHQWSGDRAHGPFVRVELRKIDPKELAGILFGHDGQPGKFTEAAGGTLFVDDVDVLPYNVQTQLLEVLTTRELPPESGFSHEPIDVRIVASTPHTMEEERHDGKFREDLFFKLSVERFELPPLRDRREDIKLLISYFLDNYNRQNRSNILMPKISQMVLFENYRCPGNVSEMEHRIYRSASFLSPGQNLVFEDRRARDLEAGGDEVEPLREALERTRRAVVQEAVSAAKGNIAVAANMLKVSKEDLEAMLRDMR